jgi:hypothetical protein
MNGAPVLQKGRGFLLRKFADQRQPVTYVYEAMKYVNQP